MRPIALAGALAVLAATGLRAAEYALTQPHPAYIVTVDRPASFTEEGMPVLAPGSVVTLRAAAQREKFTVHFFTPLSFNEIPADTVWKSTVSKTGGYRIQFGRENQELMSLFDFIVHP